MTLLSSDIVIRELESVAELKRAERFQQEVWGADDPADNSDLMLAIQHEGGLLAGAFKEDRMLGFLFGFPTSRPDVQHSHRLGVHPDSQGMGLGVKLKWFQRNWCLARGIETVCWTYDPLRSVNAGLNIARLGATANTYYKDYYGVMKGINAGVPSDRILAEWHLNTPKVREHAAGGSPPLPSNSIAIAIPRDLDALLSDDLEGAIKARLRVREALTEAFAKGYGISGFDRVSCAYLLAKPSQPIAAV